MKYTIVCFPGRSHIYIYKKQRPLDSICLGQCNNYDEACHYKQQFEKCKSIPEVIYKNNKFIILHYEMLKLNPYDQLIQLDKIFHFNKICVRAYCKVQYEESQFRFPICIIEKYIKKKPCPFNKTNICQIFNITIKYLLNVDEINFMTTLMKKLNFRIPITKFAFSLRSGIDWKLIKSHPITINDYKSSLNIGIKLLNNIYVAQRLNIGTSSLDEILDNIDNLLLSNNKTIIKYLEENITPEKIKKYYRNICKSNHINLANKILYQLMVDYPMENWDNLIFGESIQYMLLHPKISNLLFKIKINITLEYYINITNYNNINIKKFGKYLLTKLDPSKLNCDKILRYINYLNNEKFMKYLEKNVTSIEIKKYYLNICKSNHVILANKILYRLMVDYPNEDWDNLIFGGSIQYMLQYLKISDLLFKIEIRNISLTEYDTMINYSISLKFANHLLVQRLNRGFITLKDVLCNIHTLIDNDEIITFIKTRVISIKDICSCKYKQIIMFGDDKFLNLAQILLINLLRNYIRDRLAETGFKSYLYSHTRQFMNRIGWTLNTPLSPYIKLWEELDVRFYKDILAIINHPTQGVLNPGICAICHELNIYFKTDNNKACGNCNNYLCRICLKKHYNIPLFTTFSIDKLTCPCCKGIPDQNIQKYFDSKIQELYKNIEKYEANTYYIYCIECGKFMYHSKVSCHQDIPNAKNYICEDCTLYKTSTSTQYKKCPGCHSYVSKTMGCNHITCRCGEHFCYRCCKGLLVNSKGNIFNHTCI